LDADSTGQVTVRRRWQTAETGGTLPAADRWHATHTALTFPETGHWDGALRGVRLSSVIRLLIACLCSHWQSPGEPDLLSFAAITDDPPPEIALAGHDRCIIPIKPEHIDAWLNPDPVNLAAQLAILDDRMQPHFGYQMAA
jgi:hypothetical protein